MAMITMDECDRKRAKLLDKGQVGSRYCRVGGQPQEGKNFDLHPPPVVSFVGEGKIGIGSMPAEVQWTPLVSRHDCVL